MATSMKLSVAESFEKRIKSRFSHRQILLYEQNFDLFCTNLEAIFNEMLSQTVDPIAIQVINKLKNLVFGE